MRVEVSDGVVVVQFGAAFTATEAARVADALLAFPHPSEITLDFTDTRTFDAAGIPPLASSLKRLNGARLILRGLPRREARLLACFGIH